MPPKICSLRRSCSLLSNVCVLVGNSKYYISNRAITNNALFSNLSTIECKGPYGKKIVVQANVFNNLKDMLNTTLFNEYRLRFKLKTVCFESKVTRNYITLSKKIRHNQKKYPIILLEKKVFKKQMKMALLAQKFGATAKEVLNTQVRLVRTYDFRLLAVLKVIKKKTLAIDFAIPTNDEYIKIMINRLLVFLNHLHEYRTSPVRKCSIHKSSGSTGLLEISAIQNRCLQSLVTLVLEPVIEPFSDPHSFGFRNNRSAKNALAVIRYMLKGKQHGRFILDAGIKSFFSNVLHD
jgi:hypothetical protein